MEIPKEYFTLEEVLRRWKMPAVDLRYLAQTDRMRLSFLVFNREVELGCWEEVDVGRRQAFHGIMASIAVCWICMLTMFMRCFAMGNGGSRGFVMRMRNMVT